MENTKSIDDLKKEMEIATSLKSYAKANKAVVDGLLETIYQKYLWCASAALQNDEKALAAGFISMSSYLDIYATFAGAEKREKGFIDAIKKKYELEESDSVLPQ